MPSSDPKLGVLIFGNKSKVKSSDLMTSEIIDPLSSIEANSHFLFFIYVLNILLLDMSF